VCKKEDRPVPYDELAHGYEIEKGKYVMLTDEELAAAAPEKTRTIDISEFVALDEVDPIFFDHPYYLVPAGEAQGPLRAYQLLVDVMENSDKVAIGRFVLRTKEYLVAVRANEGVLALTTMLFHDEIRPTDELPLPTKKKEPAKAKIEQAVKLVEALGADFDPGAYKDRYTQRLKALVKKKEAGETIKAPERAKPPSPTPDLMAALKESLERIRSEEGDGAKKPASRSKQSKKKAPAKTAKARQRA
jgi:DNA end-binding protein Ku